MLDRRSPPPCPHDCPRPAPPSLSPRRRRHPPIVPGRRALGAAGGIDGHRSQPHPGRGPGPVRHRLRRRRPVGGDRHAQGRCRVLFDHLYHPPPDLAAPALRHELAAGPVTSAGTLADRPGLPAHRRVLRPRQPARPAQLQPLVRPRRRPDLLYRLEPVHPRRHPAWPQHSRSRTPGPGFLHRRHLHRAGRAAGAQRTDAGLRGHLAVLLGAVQPLAWSSVLVLAGLAGMAAGFVCNKLYREAPWSGQ